MGETYDKEGPDTREELLRPSIEAARPRTERPWDPSSQFYVAFFGGVLAVAGIALINARRLRLPASRQRWMLAIGLAGLVVALVLAAVMPIDPDVGAFVNEGSRNIRLAGRVVAVAICLAFVKLQQPGDRLFRIQGGEYASLWGPGILAVIVGGLAQAALVAVVVDAR
jgi:hypothetical protein